MRKFKCPKCDNDTVVETIEHVIEYRVFRKIDEYDSPDYESDDRDYDDAHTLDFTCEMCGFWLGTELDEVVEVFFKEAD